MWQSVSKRTLTVLCIAFVLVVSVIVSIPGSSANASQRNLAIARMQSAIVQAQSVFLVKETSPKQLIGVWPPTSQPAAQGLPANLVIKQDTLPSGDGPVIDDASLKASKSDDYRLDAREINLAASAREQEITAFKRAVSAYLIALQNARNVAGNCIVHRDGKTFVLTPSVEVREAVAVASLEYNQDTCRMMRMSDCESTLRPWVNDPYNQFAGLLQQQISYWPERVAAFNSQTNHFPLSGDIHNAMDNERLSAWMMATYTPDPFGNWPVCQYA